MVRIQSLGKAIPSTRGKYFYGFYLELLWELTDGLLVNFAHNFGVVLSTNLSFTTSNLHWIPVSAYLFHCSF
jgi:hypothetical protein